MNTEQDQKPLSIKSVLLQDRRFHCKYRTSVKSKDLQYLKKTLYIKGLDTFLHVKILIGSFREQDVTSSIADPDTHSLENESL